MIENTMMSTPNFINDKFEFCASAQRKCCILFYVKNSNNSRNMKFEFRNSSFEQPHSQGISLAWGEMRRGVPWERADGSVL